MRRVLIASYFYPPLAGGGVHRVLSFTRHLPRHGWACTVVCAGANDYWVRDESLLAEIPDGTEVVRVSGGSALSALLGLGGAPATGRRSGAGFSVLRALSDWWFLPDSYAGWARRARRAVRERVARGGIDAVLTSSPPDSVHLASGAAPRPPWVADFRDPWVGLGFRRPPTPWHRARQAAMEAGVLSGADLVLAASRTHADELAARAQGRPRRLLHLPNGYEPAPAAPAGRDAGHFRVAFTGTLSLMEDVGTLLDAVRELLEREPSARERVRVDLAGPVEREWPARAEQLGLGAVVRFPGPLAHDEARAIQRRADVLLLWKPRGQGYRTMVPGKLYEYLDSGRPVLALLPPGDEAGGLVERASGTRIAPGDATALAQELRHRYMRWCAGERVPDLRPDWLADHTRERLAGVLAGALDSLVGRQGA